MARRSQRPSGVAALAGSEALIETGVSAPTFTWSGGDASLAFNDTAGPNASKMLLDFFARHRRILK